MAGLTQAMMEAASRGEMFEQEREPYDDEVLMCGYLIKLGHRVKNWKHRWVVVRGNGRLQYFKQSPTAAKPLIAMRPQGQINLRRDCLELITWNRCNEVMQDLSARTVQTIKWPDLGNEHSAFGIRTTYRDFLLVAPDGDAQSWVQGLDEVCRRCDIYEGIDQMCSSSNDKTSGSGNGNGKPHPDRSSTLPSSPFNSMPPTLASERAYSQASRPRPAATRLPEGTFDFDEEDNDDDDDDTDDDPGAGYERVRDALDASHTSQSAPSSTASLVHSPARAS
ncbi:hypothetical protein PTSG_05048 [Salpingoeca rosetta]|uniref:PH domain-containing protein n=1 Tax=Salpingoeca rosetta (strain ATCC 50818 / BSB-021) TaxID=946362 RepID=F2U9D4_SALR5|nr:uncharacterized protein PTSG_05048 [Salpingoeca rosetta]EGD73337.1 hypothetical protein PTSG_05048 [Salpingoeca rosetta]|eukprot:XP_004994367.1 hypothetical protein PTSG_05048 [Salpingoeca rosetta]